jgi:hypothetical protein
MTKGILEHILVSNISVDEIVGKFKEINETVSSLFQCSNEDFKFLNDKFKEYYKQTQSISDSAKNLFNLISKNKLTSTVEEKLDYYYKQLESYDNTFREITGSLNELLEHSDRNLELIAVPKNNLYQSYMVLKLVLNHADLKQLFDKEKGDDIKNKLLNLFNDIEEKYMRYNKTLDVLKEHVKDVRKKIAAIEEFHVQQINSILNNIEYSKELLSKKNQVAAQKYPDLYNLVVDNTENKDKIVTNLQYHDIIRQKMEHIQQAYENVIENLSMNGKDKNRSNKELSSVILQVRDIARIQASQLYHTNKDYQKAIEEISESLLNMGENVIVISDMCDDFAAISGKGKADHFSEISEQLKATIKLKGKLIKNNIEIDTHYSSVSTQISSFINAFNDMYKPMNQLFGLNKYLEDDGDSDKDHLKLSRLHIKLLLKEIEQNLNSANGLSKNIINAYNKTRQEVAESMSEEVIEKELRNLSDNGYELITHIDECKDKLKSMIGQNDDYCTGLSDQILKDVRKVKYYDDFDKKVKTIIDKHSEIFDNINLNNEDGLDELDILKSHYTMKSERDVHQLSFKEMGDDNGMELFVDDSAEKGNGEEQDSNIELF